MIKKKHLVLKRIISKNKNHTFHCLAAENLNCFELNKRLLILNCNYEISTLE